MYISKSNQALTNSLLVAKTFGKSHKNVLESVKNLLDMSAENSAHIEFQELSKDFELVMMDIPMPNGGIRKSPVYVMNEEGFTMLAMGFTGSKAMLFKTRCAKAFREMREQLSADETKRIEEERKRNGLPKDFFMGLFGFDANENRLSID